MGAIGPGRAYLACGKCNGDLSSADEEYRGWAAIVLTPRAVSAW